MEIKNTQNQLLIDKKGVSKMSTIEYAQHKVVEYTILKKAALKAEDYFLAEYYDTLIKDTLKEIITLA